MAKKNLHKKTSSNLSITIPDSDEENSLQKSFKKEIELRNKENYTTNSALSTKFIDLNLVLREDSNSIEGGHQSSAKEKICIEEIFRASGQQDQVEINRVLIDGAIGAGNTSLLHEIQAKWALGALWPGEFDYVFLLPLDILKNPNWYQGMNPGSRFYTSEEMNKYALACFIHSALENQDGVNNFSVEDINHAIQSSRVLYLVDDLDLASYKGFVKKKIIDPLLNFDHVIFTATNFPPSDTKFCDRIIDNFGFDEVSLQQYIDGIQEEGKADFINGALKNNSELKLLLQNPCNLSALNKLLNSPQALKAADQAIGIGEEVVWNLTKFYEVISYLRAKQYFQKKDEGDLSAEEIFASKEFAFMQKALFEAHSRGSIFIDKKILNECDLTSQHLRDLDFVKVKINDTSYYKLNQNSIMYDFYAAVHVHNKLKDPTTKIEYLKFVARSKHYPEKHMMLKFLSGMLSQAADSAAKTNDESDEKELFFKFWQAINQNVEGILAIGQHQGIMLWFELMEECKSSKYFASIPDLEINKQIVDLNILRFFSEYSKILIQNTYCPEVIADSVYAFFVQGDGEYMNRQKQKTLDDLLPTLQNRRFSTASNDSRADDSKDSLVVEKPVSDAVKINIIEVAISIINEFDNQKKQAFFDKAVQEFKEFQQGQTINWQIIPSLVRLMMVLIKDKSFIISKDAIEFIGKEIITLVNNDNLRPFVVNNAEKIISIFGIDHQDVRKISEDAMHAFSNKEISYSAARILMCLSKEAIQDLEFDFSGYITPQSVNSATSVSSKMFNFRSEEKVKSVKSYSSALIKPLLISEHEECQEYKTDNDQQFVYPENKNISKYFSKLFSTTHSSKKKATEEILKELATFTLDELLRGIKSDCQSKFKKLIIDVTSFKLNSLECQEEIIKQIKNNQFEIIKDLLELVSYNVIEKNYDQCKLSMAKMVEVDSSVLRNIAYYSSHAMLEWVLKNFKELTNLSKYTKDFYKDLFHQALSDSVLEPIEIEFMSKCNDKFGFTCIFDLDGQKIIFNRVVYDLKGGYDAMNAVASVMLDKAVKSSPLMYKQYLLNEPLFNACKEIPNASIDCKMSSLVDVNLLLTFKEWHLSLMHLVKEKIEPGAKELKSTLENVFLMMEGRDAFGKYIVYLLKNNGQEVLFETPLNAVKTEFRKKIFGEMEYTNDSKCRYYSQSLEVPLDAINKILSSYIKIKDNLECLERANFLEILQLCENIPQDFLQAIYPPDSWRCQQVLKKEELLFSDIIEARRQSANVDNKLSLQTVKEQIEALDFSLLVKMQDEERVSQEVQGKIQYIKSNEALYDFYFALCLQLNGLYAANLAINTGVISGNQKGILGEISKNITFAADYVPVFGTALNLVAECISAVDKVLWQEKITNFANIAISVLDMAKIVQVIAIKLTTLLDHNKIKSHETLWDKEFSTPGDASDEIAKFILLAQQEMKKSDNSSDYTRSAAEAKALIVARAIAKIIYSGEDDFRKLDAEKIAEIICNKLPADWGAIESKDEEESKQESYDSMLSFNDDFNQFILNSEHLQKVSAACDKCNASLLVQVKNAAAKGWWKVPLLSSFTFFKNSAKQNEGLEKLLSKANIDIALTKMEQNIDEFVKHRDDNDINDIALKIILITAVCSGLKESQLKKNVKISILEKLVEVWPAAFKLLQQSHIIEYINQPIEKINAEEVKLIKELKISSDKIADLDYKYCFVDNSGYQHTEAKANEFSWSSSLAASTDVEDLNLQKLVGEIQEY